jgi:hypothetical protein
VICQTTAEGCVRWSEAVPCPPDLPFCSNGKCAAGCTDECTTHGSKRCLGTGYQVCGEHDNDPCLDWGPTLPCANDPDCPKRCPPGSCGNGKCDPGETPTNCSRDCKSPCVDGQSKCAGSSKIKICAGGIWQTHACSSICKKAGYDYDLECRLYSPTGLDTCICDYYRDFSQLCDPSKKCAPGLVCVVYGSKSTGFCTKYCSTSGATCSGGPSSTYSTCEGQITNSSGTHKVCIFRCDVAFCPTGMTCDYSDWNCKPN